MAQAAQAPEGGATAVGVAEALRRRYGLTHRVDRWWLEPALVGSVLFIFIAYSSVSAILGDTWEFEVGPYLSPFYEPLIRPDALPHWFSPALLVLWAPLSFRTTCYYYRCSQTGRERGVGTTKEKGECLTHARVLNRA